MRSEQYTEKVDIYSFAMVLWYMIHGERPLHTTSQRDFMAAAANNMVCLCVPRACVRILA